MRKPSSSGRDSPRSAVVDMGAIELQVGNTKSSGNGVSTAFYAVPESSNLVVGESSRPIFAKSPSNTVVVGGESPNPTRNIEILRGDKNARSAHCDNLLKEKKPQYDGEAMRYDAEAMQYDEEDDLEEITKGIDLDEITSFMRSKKSNNRILILFSLSTFVVIGIVCAIVVIVGHYSNKEDRFDTKVSPLIHVDSTVPLIDVGVPTTVAPIDDGPFTVANYNYLRGSRSTTSKSKSTTSTIITSPSSSIISPTITDTTEIQITDRKNPYDDKAVHINPDDKSVQKINPHEKSVQKINPYDKSVQKTDKTDDQNKRASRNFLQSTKHGLRWKSIFEKKPKKLTGNRRKRTSNSQGELTLSKASKLSQTRNTSSEERTTGESILQEIIRLHRDSGRFLHEILWKSEETLLTKEETEEPLSGFDAHSMGEVEPNKKNLISGMVGGMKNSEGTASDVASSTHSFLENQQMDEFLRLLYAANIGGKKIDIDLVSSLCGTPSSIKAFLKKPEFEEDTEKKRALVVLVDRMVRQTAEECSSGSPLIIFWREVAKGLQSAGYVEKSEVMIPEIVAWLNTPECLEIKAACGKDSTLQKVVSTIIGKMTGGALPLIVLGDDTISEKLLGTNLDSIQKNTDTIQKDVQANEKMSKQTADFIVQVLVGLQGRIGVGSSNPMLIDPRAHGIVSEVVADVLKDAGKLFLDVLRDMTVKKLKDSNEFLELVGEGDRDAFVSALQHVMPGVIWRSLSSKGRTAVTAEVMKEETTMQRVIDAIEKDIQGKFSPRALNNIEATLTFIFGGEVKNSKGYESANPDKQKDYMEAANFLGGLLPKLSEKSGTIDIRGVVDSVKANPDSGFAGSMASTMQQVVDKVLDTMMQEALEMMEKHIGTLFYDYVSQEMQTIVKKQSNDPAEQTLHKALVLFKEVFDSDVAKVKVGREMRQDDATVSTVMDVVEKMVSTAQQVAGLAAKDENDRQCLLRALLSNIKESSEAKAVKVANLPLSGGELQMEDKARMEEAIKTALKTAVRQTCEEIKTGMVPSLIMKASIKSPSSGAQNHPAEASSDASSFLEAADYASNDASNFLETHEAIMRDENVKKFLLEPIANAGSIPLYGSATTIKDGVKGFLRHLDDTVKETIKNAASMFALVEKILESISDAEHDTEQQKPVRFLKEVLKKIELEKQESGSASIVNTSFNKLGDDKGKLKELVDKAVSDVKYDGLLEQMFFAPMKKAKVSDPPEQMNKRLKKILLEKKEIKKKILRNPTVTEMLEIIREATDATQKQASSSSSHEQKKDSEDIDEKVKEFLTQLEDCIDDKMKKKKVFDEAVRLNFGNSVKKFEEHKCKEKDADVQKFYIEISEVIQKVVVPSRAGDIRKFKETIGTERMPEEIIPCIRLWFLEYKNNVKAKIKAEEATLKSVIDTIIMVILGANPLVLAEREKNAHAIEKALNETGDVKLQMPKSVAKFFSRLLYTISTTKESNKLMINGEKQDEKRKKMKNSVEEAVRLVETKILKEEKKKKSREDNASIPSASTLFDTVKKAIYEEEPKPENNNESGDKKEKISVRIGELLEGESLESLQMWHCVNDAMKQENATLSSVIRGLEKEITWLVKGDTSTREILEVGFKKQLQQLRSFKESNTNSEKDDANIAKFLSVFFRKIRDKLGKGKITDLMKIKTEMKTQAKETFQKMVDAKEKSEKTTEGTLKEFEKKIEEGIEEGIEHMVEGGEKLVQEAEHFAEDVIEEGVKDVEGVFNGVEEAVRDSEKSIVDEAKKFGQEMKDDLHEMKKNVRQVEFEVVKTEHNAFHACGGSPCGGNSGPLESIWDDDRGEHNEKFRNVDQFIEDVSGAVLMVSAPSNEATLSTLEETQKWYPKLKEMVGTLSLWFRTFLDESKKEEINRKMQNATLKDAIDALRDAVKSEESESGKPLEEDLQATGLDEEAAMFFGNVMQGIEQFIAKTSSNNVDLVDADKVRNVIRRVATEVLHRIEKEKSFAWFFGVIEEAMKKNVLVENGKDLPSLEAKDMVKNLKTWHANLSDAERTNQRDVGLKAFSKEMRRAITREIEKSENKLPENTADFLNGILRGILNKVYASEKAVSEGKAEEAKDEAEKIVDAVKNPIQDLRGQQLEICETIISGAVEGMRKFNNAIEELGKELTEDKTRVEAALRAALISMGFKRNDDDSKPRPIGNLLEEAIMLRCAKSSGEAVKLLKEVWNEVKKPGVLRKFNKLGERKLTKLEKKVDNAKRNNQELHDFSKDLFDAIKEKKKKRHGFSENFLGYQKKKKKKK